MDPDVIQPSDREYYRQIDPPPGGFRSYSRPRTLEQLQDDLNRAHANLKKQQHVNDNLYDNLKKQVRANDSLYGEVLEMSKQLGKAYRWIKWITTALVLTWVSWIGIIAWLTKLAAPYLIKGWSQ